MELRQLVSFYHEAQLRSVSKAARALELGRPTVTTHLRKLENAFGITFFERARRPMKLTSEGDALLKLVTPVVTSVGALPTQMNHCERRGSIVVGAYPDLVTYHLPQGIQRFRKDFPAIRIQLLALSYQPLIQLLRSGEIDLAFCSSPPTNDSDLEFNELFTYKPVLVTPLGHRLADGRHIELDDIASWPLILPDQASLLRERVDRAFKNRGLAADVLLAVDDTESMKRYVDIGMGIGIGIGNDFALRGDDYQRFGGVRLDHRFPGSEIGVCTLKAKFAGQAVRNFVAIMSEQIRDYHGEVRSWKEETKSRAGFAEVGAKVH